MHTLLFRYLITDFIGRRSCAIVEKAGGLVRSNRLVQVPKEERRCWYTCTYCSWSTLANTQVTHTHTFSHTCHVVHTLRVFVRGVFNPHSDSPNAFWGQKHAPII